MRDLLNLNAGILNALPVNGLIAFVAHRLSSGSASKREISMRAEEVDEGGRVLPTISTLAALVAVVEGP